MKKSNLISFLSLFFVCMIAVAFANSDDFKKEKNENTEALQLNSPFDKVMAVLMHKRCVNCHPAGNTPLQGEDSHLHHFDVVRGDKDHGLVGYTCNSCHTDENNTFSGVPGAPHWAIAPSNMAWEGKTRIEIASQVMDPSRNGGRSHTDILKHLTEDELVLWAWDPGVNAEGLKREIPPVSKEDFIEAVKEWINAGAIIPAE